MKIPRPSVNYIEAAFDWSHYPHHLLPGEQTWSLRLLAPDPSRLSHTKAALVVGQDAIMARAQERLAHELGPWLYGEGDLDVAIVEDSAILSGRSSGHRTPRVKPTSPTPAKPASPPTKIFIHLNVPDAVGDQVEMFAAFTRALLGADVISSENVAFIAGYLSAALEDAFLSSPTTDAAGAPDLAGAGVAAQAYKSAVSLLFDSFAHSGGAIGVRQDRTVAQIYELLSLPDPELYLILNEARYPGHGDEGGRRPHPPYGAADLAAALSNLIAGDFLEQVFLYAGPGGVGGWFNAQDALARDPNFDFANAMTQFRRTARWRRQSLPFNVMRLTGLI